MPSFLHHPLLNPLRNILSLHRILKYVWSERSNAEAAPCRHERVKRCSPVLPVQGEGIVLPRYTGIVPDLDVTLQRRVSHGRATIPKVFSDEELKKSPN